MLQLYRSVTSAEALGYHVLETHDTTLTLQILRTSPQIKSAYMSLNHT